MSNAVFHIIFAIFIAEIIREFIRRKKFPIMYVFIAGLAGILPDLDVVAFWILYFFGFTIEQVHRTFTHTLFLPMIFLIFAGISWKFKNKSLGRHHLKLHTIFLMIALGSFIHLILDAIIVGNIMPFYPFFKLTVGLNLVTYLPYALQQIALPCSDAGIFILWLVWLEYKHKISDFI
ncbi:MAG: metal-dependent hydrolase [Candidatus Pacearchaeota archaeon]|nr:metal-dependent hydrolase [Candidatus Pacearchaeota archaeon]